MSDDLFKARLRFTEIMRRHVRAEDCDLSDVELTASVWARYLQARAQPLIDPNE